MSATARPAAHVAQDPPGVARRRVERWRAGQRSAFDDAVAEEVPVALVFNDAPFAVMMATPADLDDFVLGFALSEGVVARVEEVEVEAVDELMEGVEVRARIPPARAEALARRRRNLSGRSGCGICGTEMLEAALRHPPAVAADPRVEAGALRGALQALRDAQVLAAATGATHAAGWADLDGTLRLVREDVGRHNALDKLIGAMAVAGVDPAAGFCVVTSRASYEMAMKAASAGVGLLAAISAPTALAISLAERCRLTLVGFARDDGHAVYTHPQRLRHDRADAHQD
ncbi:formate dehydrogenase accessory sulfurtransferase FdhD [Coralloluteibacterium stylophorae]|uniref:Sulfur carrier protein FdhD n=1 Tax=Coralloluteibacterium stylophorae TaxID=1776034 RepID=A0A8J8AXK1_9GAMM|nr:formate dehydrogenase accessory sulfurtransferase FdhD [Coralloluteibacterium stylophorae]MBS7456227.1 formate dehydrogenase accessory sulfurtransferase FdhD [Coralloluteibacterium stylophorae]